jgi:hypothetical protein
VIGRAHAWRWSEGLHEGPHALPAPLPPRAVAEALAAPSREQTAARIPGRSGSPLEDTSHHGLPDIGGVDQSHHSRGYAGWDRANPGPEGRTDAVAPVRGGRHDDAR